MDVCPLALIQGTEVQRHGKEQIFCLYARAGVRMLLLTPSNVIANGKHMGKGKYWFLQKQAVFFFFFVLCVSVSMPVMQNDMFFFL